MAANKMTKQELRAPDSFQRVGGEAREWLQARQGLVAGLAAAGLVLCGGVAVASYVSGRGEEKATQELGQALKSLDRPVSAAATPAEPGDEAPFKTQEEKDRATVAALSAFRNLHRSGRASDTAALPLAQAQLRLGQYGEAVSGFQTYLKGAPSGDVLRASALEGEGYAYEAQGQLDAALTAYDQLAREPTAEYLNGMGMYHRARVLALQNKKDEAAKEFVEVSADFPTSAAAKLSQDRIALLAAAGVKIPAKPVMALDGGMH